MTGIILAGGSSTRAKLNKLLLEVDRKPLISHAINSMSPFVDRIIVVTGKYDQELRPYLKDVDVVYNDKHEQGMFTSVLAGINQVHDDVLILPADIPNISKQTFQKLLAAEGEIKVPMYQGATGHPLYLSKEKVLLLQNENPQSNLHEFLKKHEITNVQVDDPFINFDIDTLDDYNSLVKQMERR